MRRRWIVLVVLVLPLLGVLVHLGDFPRPANSEYSDFAVSHYPNAVFLQQSVLKDGEIPFWSSTIFSGYPFAANPLSGLWYPPGWLAFILPQPAGLNLMVALHLLWGGLGMHRLLVRRGVTFSAALAGAIVFLANPKIFAHLAAGHVTLLYAVAWTPWLLLVETRHKPWALAGAVLGLILLADVRWVIPAGLIWILWKLYLLAGKQHPVGDERLVTDWKRFVASAAASLLVAGLIAAPLIILLGEYTLLSTRVKLTLSEQLDLSLPLGNLINFLIPKFSAYAEWVTYIGALPLMLLIFTLAVPALRKQTAFWIAVLVGSILISLGSAVPGLDLLWRIPGFSLLRVPSRMLLLGGIAFAFITAHSLDYLLDRRSLPKVDPVFWMTPFVTFTWVWAFGIGILWGDFSLEFLWAAVAHALTVTLIVIRRRTSVSNLVWVGLVIVLLLVDSGGVNLQNLRFEPAKTVLAQSEKVAKLFDDRNGPFRVYSPSYAIQQQSAAALGLELADGVDPLQLSAYANFFNSASGIETTGYSVTLPPEPLEPVESNPARAAPDAEKLGLLNVRYLVANYPLRSPGLELMQEVDGHFVYENQTARPRVWVQRGDESIDLVSTSAPVITHRSANRIEILANGPGRLVLSEVMYPGWRAWVDEQEVPIELVEELLRSVILPAGRHQVRFEFSPRGLSTGVLLSTFGWLAVIAVPWFLDRKWWLRNEE